MPFTKQDLALSTMWNYRKASSGEELMDQLMALGFVSSLVMGAVLMAAAPWAPRLYNTTEQIMGLSSGLMRIGALFMPVGALTNCAYWALRAGGRTYITMAFDSVFTWVASVPVAWTLIHYTGWSLLSVNAAVNAADLIKLGVGLVLLHKGVWVNNIVAGKVPAEETA